MGENKGQELPKNQILTCTIIQVQATRFGISFETDTEFVGFDEAHEIKNDKTNFVWSCHRISKEFAKVSLTFAKLLTKGKVAEESAPYVEFINFCLKGAKVEISRKFVPAGTNSDVEYDTYYTSLNKLVNENEIVQSLTNPLNSFEFKAYLTQLSNIQKAASIDPMLLDMSTI